jgi:23S rRNA (adenine1618-N6)-methyltransferase
LTSPPDKSGLHPRNRHRGRYDLKALSESLPALARFVAKNRFGDDSVDFADPEAVKTLNRAILKRDYGIDAWDIPPGYLCPPIPGRAEYVHRLADLLSSPREARILDVGVGANCVYPIIGRREYGWSFVGSDVDPAALASARAIVSSNPLLAGSVELRLQPDPVDVFRGVVREDETFDACLCNPPFHASREEARAGTRRKLAGLGRSGAAGAEPPLNFAGKDSELWCAGGEAGFARRMIAESARIPDRIGWFTTLISKESHLTDVYRELKRAKALETRTIPMAHGNKVGRIVAWTFRGEVSADGRAAARSRPRDRRA